ncbi:Supervillin [Fasciola hepatica]|uniref:Supervillin n=1 Tax=Fasciola hepatica TaxID=6192 RepID=A0A4E0RM99_FASHE|nr:Supervillin [Fasciola hepatica]
MPVEMSCVYLFIFHHFVLPIPSPDVHSSSLLSSTTHSSCTCTVGVRASVVYAGLEPSQFLALFPPQVRSPEITANYNHEEYKSDGQMDDVNDLLATNKPGSYTLYDLQQRPLPPDLDATCLEVYLDNDSFQVGITLT